MSTKLFISRGVVAAFVFSGGVLLSQQLNKKPLTDRSRSTAEAPESRSNQSPAPAPAAVRWVKTNAEDTQYGADETVISHQQLVDGAEFLLDSLLTRTEAFPELAQKNPELAAKEAFSLVEGIALAVNTSVGNKMIGPLRERVEKMLCDRETSDAKAISLAYLLTSVPQVASQSGFECFFSGHTKEGVAVWSMLDAWRGAGAEVTPAIAALQGSAADERTKRRLMKVEDEIALRSQADMHRRAYPPVKASPPPEFSHPNQ